MSEKQNVSYERLFKIGVKALMKRDVTRDHSEIVMNAILRAEFRGIETHGIVRLPTYVQKLKKKIINANPDINVTVLSPAITLIDGDNGLGQLVASIAMNEAIKTARETGISFVGCRGSNHYGAGAPYVLTACSRKLIGIAGTNVFPMMAPWGGTEKLIGNNPISIGIPGEIDDHFVLDMAITKSSRARIRDMAERNELLEPGWALDSDGRPTRNAREALDGILAPIGTYKGYGLAMVVDILSGLITGSGYSKGVKSLSLSDDIENTGHFFIVIDPVSFMPWNEYRQKIEKLFTAIRESKRVDEGIPIRIPGDRQREIERLRMEKGTPINASLLRKLELLARD